MSLSCKFATCLNSMRKLWMGWEVFMKLKQINTERFWRFQFVFNANAKAILRHVSSMNVRMPLNVKESKIWKLDCFALLWIAV